ncbi:hypothetical protein [Bacillus subtilis]|uniref:hypothetical protein n=1 Tax=Bacillus subtilis TaxID=1423 RepID=UPI003F76E23D
MANSLNDDLKIIAEKSKDLTTLFQKTDSIIDYYLDKKLEVEYVIDSLKLLGGSTFSKLIIFVLVKSLEDEDLLFSEEEIQGVDKDLLEHCIYLRAKYGAKFLEALKIQKNEHAWSSINYAFISDQVNGKSIELKISKSNNDEFYIKDGFEEMINLSEKIIDSVKSLYANYEFTKEEEDSILEQITNLKETVISFEELLKK